MTDLPTREQIEESDLKGTLTKDDPPGWYEYQHKNGHKEHLVLRWSGKFAYMTDRCDHSISVGWFTNFRLLAAAEQAIDLQAKLVEVERERDELRVRLLSAAGDDLCRLSQDEIKELTSGAVQIPPQAEFLASCERFHEQIAAGPGVLSDCLTLAQLIAENQRLREQLERVTPKRIVGDGRTPLTDGRVYVRIQSDGTWEPLKKIDGLGMAYFYLMRDSVYLDYGIPDFEAAERELAQLKAQQQSKETTQ